jgi:nucleoside-diphosphate-sugar epimerase
MARFLITDIVRAIRNGDILITSSNNIIRDFIGPDDFFRLISSILESSIENDVVDCYTKEPVDKITLLKSMKQHLGLSYKISETLEGVNATGGKTNYFSKNHKAEIYGYKPLMKSLDMVIFEAKKIINANL